MDIIACNMHDKKMVKITQILGPIGSCYLVLGEEVQNAIFQNWSLNFSHILKFMMHNMFTNNKYSCWKLKEKKIAIFFFEKWVQNKIDTL